MRAPKFKRQPLCLHTTRDDKLTNVGPGRLGGRTAVPAKDLTGEDVAPRGGAEAGADGGARVALRPLELARPRHPHRLVADAQAVCRGKTLSKRS